MYDTYSHSSIRLYYYTTTVKILCPMYVVAISHNLLAIALEHTVCLFKTVSQYKHSYKCSTTTIYYAKKTIQ